MDYSIENESLKITVSSKGAELTSVFNKKENRECLWNADPSAWNRHSPVLFPVVGKFRDCKYTHLGKTYEMGQHGFARDMEFDLLFKDDNAIGFALTETEETLAKYPFKFWLSCGYVLEESTVKVIWKVKNTGDSDMYFSIGGHPAFVGRKGSLTGAELKFDKEGSLDYYLINGNGNKVNEKHTLALNGNSLTISEDLFDKDALIVEDKNINKVSLFEDGKRLVKVTTPCPLFGLWSAKGKGNPFVCIEPWFGRCDAEDFEGTLSEREYGNSLKPGKEYESGFEMEF